MNFINHHKWLVDSDLLTDEMRDNVAMGAYCLIEGVVEASTNMDFETHTVSYKLLLPEVLYVNLTLLNKYENKEDLGFFEMRRLKKFLTAKKENDESGLGYKLEDIANTFIKAYLNEKWSVKVDFRSVNDYDGKANLWLHSEDNPESN